MNKFIDRTGQRYGRLVVIEKVNEFSKDYGINRNTIYSRLFNGWEESEAVTTKAKQNVSK